MSAGDEAREARAEADEPRCEICGTTEDLRIAPIMTGDRFGQPPKHPVCGACVTAWYEGGGTTAEEILSYRGIASAQVTVPVTTKEPSLGGSCPSVAKENE